MILRLRQPPLAQWTRARSLRPQRRRARLSTRAPSSRAYLANLAARAAGAATAAPPRDPGCARRPPLHRRAQRPRRRASGDEAPGTRPPGSRSTPSSTRASATGSRSTAARQLIERRRALAGRRRGARGEGIKIGVVDDGIDQSNAFFDPAGYAYPPGFPKGGDTLDDAEGDRRARVPRPRRGRAQPPRGRPARVVPRHARRRDRGRQRGHDGAGRRRPPAHDRPLRRRAARAGSATTASSTSRRRSATSANTPEIVAAFESAVADGMDVINFSGGGPRPSRRTTR